MQINSTLLVVNIMKTIIDFFQIWVMDFLKYPLRYIGNVQIKNNTKNRFRKPIKSNIVQVCIHEWGGYDEIRLKKIKNIEPFKCGLKYQIQRFRPLSLCSKVSLTVTMSDVEKNPNVQKIIKSCDNFISVPNLGMDFSGYCNFYKKIQKLDNAYVILTNTSVNKKQCDFLDDYIKYMEKNKDVGILGVSCSSKYYHTLVRNNFNPHLQSFFLLTTIDVINEIVIANNGIFPGINEHNKHLLIRNGEVQISRLALKLGYNLAVVTENGVFKFNYSNYPLAKGDLRIRAKNPNSINPITDRK